MIAIALDRKNTFSTLASESQIDRTALGLEANGIHTWIVGAQELVKELGEGLRRITKYGMPLEDMRLLKTYRMNTSLNKLLIFYKGRPVVSL